MPTNTQASTTNRIVVVGGVAGGMSAAARARRIAENADIIVLERGGEVSFANCGLPYYVSGEITDAAKLQVQTPQSLGASLNLDVRTHSNVTHLDPANNTVTVQHTNTDTGNTNTYTLTYDALILTRRRRHHTTHRRDQLTTRAHTPHRPRRHRHARHR